MKPAGNFRTSFPHLDENLLALRYFFTLIVENKKAQLIDIQSVAQYPGRDLNPHSRNGHRILSPACLPVPPPGQKIRALKLKVQSFINTKTLNFVLWSERRDSNSRP